jgi:spore germination protein GerM
MAKSAKKITPRIILLVSLAVLLAVLAVIFFRGGEKEKIRHETEASPAKGTAAAPAEKGVRTVRLYFLSEDDDLLHAEHREIAAGKDIASEIETTVGELLKGSSGSLVSPFPADTKLRQVFVTKDGTAYVDFGKGLGDNASYGASSEMAAVYALVNTVAFNFKSVRRVSILVEGAERETLGGHIDLSRPLVPQYSLVAK